MPYAKNSIEGQDEIQEKYPDDIKFDGHDRYINRGMEKFGREYLLW